MTGNTNAVDDIVYASPILKLSDKITFALEVSKVPVLDKDKTYIVFTYMTPSFDKILFPKIKTLYKILTYEENEQCEQCDVKEYTMDELEENVKVKSKVKKLKVKSKVQ